ncbi:MAG TPA: HNH endonuclease [Rubrobacter sp.]|nr:HNH endonuclease [Rubrobacter sp.]
MRKSRRLLPGRRRDVPTDPENLHYYWRLPEAVKKEVWERDEGRCQWCGTEGTPENPIEYDHIYPWSLGGENTVEHLELLCRKHNREKGDRVYARGLEHFSERARRRRRGAV